MAEGYVIGSGGGAGLEEDTGGTSIPIYIDGEGEAQPITSIDPSLLNNTFKNGVDFFVSGIKKTSKVVEGKTIDLINVYYSNSVRIDNNDVLMGAGWNDFAEFRLCEESAGTCVIEGDFGKLRKSTKRLQKGGQIISDTYGMIVGPDTSNTQAVAIAGRVLAKPDNSKFKPGDAVCTGKDGTVSKMNRLEIILFPDRIIGYVSEIPTYDIWNKKVEINNRIWIKVV